jgi:hypothetical protein
MRRLATQLVPPQRGNRSDQGYLKLSVSPKVSTGDRWFESISLQRRVSCEPRSRRSAQAASIAIDLSDAEAISLMSVAVLLFSPMVVLALTNRFRLVPRLNEEYHFARQIVALVSVK